VAAEPELVVEHRAGLNRSNDNSHAVASVAVESRLWPFNIALHEDCRARCAGQFELIDRRTEIADRALDFIARSLLTEILVANTENIASIDARAGNVKAGVDVLMEVHLKSGGSTSVAGQMESVHSVQAKVGNETGLHARPAALVAAALLPSDELLVVLEELLPQAVSTNAAALIPAIATVNFFVGL